MPRRSSYGLFVALACGGMVASSGAFAISACSSSTADSGTADAGGTDAPTDSYRGTDASPEPDGAVLTPAQCKAKCKADHPNAIPKEDAIDKCWADSCTAPCIDQSGGFDAGDAGDDGGDAGDAGADAGGLLCGTKFLSGVTVTCDQCTEAFCCAPWKGCYDDPDCTAYDVCVAKCNP